MNFNTKTFRMKKKKNEEAFQTKFTDESLDRYSYDKWFDIPNDKELIY